MEEYKSNSHKSRREKIKTEQPEKRVEKVVSGSVKTKKRNGLRKLTNVFIPEDVDNVKSYIFEDIVVPAVKDIILDAVKAVLGTNGKNGRKSTASKVSYRKYYDPAEPRKITIIQGTHLYVIMMIFSLTPGQKRRMCLELWTKYLQPIR